MRIIQTFQKNGQQMVYRNIMSQQSQVLTKIVILMNQNKVQQILRKIKVKKAQNL